jgi:hypothetical protein
MKLHRPHALAAVTTAAVTTASVMAAFSVVPPAAAHHSHSMFDLTVEQTIMGTVKAFAFQNPHGYLYVNVPDGESGKLTTYVIEMSHVQNMLSRGITAATFKPGDNVTIRMNPLHGGRPGGEYISISKDGKEFGRGAEP